MEKQMNITQKSTPNQSSRNGYKPCLIVWHIADGTYNGTVAWEMNRDSQVSSHFVLGQGGEITQLVPLERAAWTQGVVKNPTHPYVKAHSGVNPNLYCVSIECEGVWSETKGALTDKQLAAAAELTRYIVAEVKRIYKVDIPIDREHMIGHCREKWRFRTVPQSCPIRSSAGHLRTRTTLPSCMQSWVIKAISFSCRTRRPSRCASGSLPVVKKRRRPAMT